MSNIPRTIGRYQVLGEIGRGGMGALYHASDPKLGRQIAIKILIEDNEELRERFSREARSAASLKHAHIVTIFELGEDQGRPFIAMEYIQGHTLGQLIRETPPPSLLRKLRLLEELCDGLAFAHRSGIVHRDIKPANIMVDADGKLKILDFGIARLAQSTTVTRKGSIIGTLNYMAPEQFGGPDPDHRADIFAVGAVAYELFSLRQAFAGALYDGLLHRVLNRPVEPLSSVCPGLDPEIVQIVERCLEKDPDDRYDDLGQMLKELRRVSARLQHSDETAIIGSERPRLSGNAPTPTPTPTPTPAIDGSRRAVDREELARRRARQIGTYLDTAVKAIDEGDYEGGIAACEEVLVLDAENPRALDLLERARSLIEQRQAEEFLAEADRELRRGALTSAAVFIDKAAALAPSLPQILDLRRRTEGALRERERARQRAEDIRKALERSHQSFDRGAFREAVAAADEALALDADHAEARRLKLRATEAYDAQQRAEHDRQARDAVREARRLFSAGSHDAAVQLLAQFEPAHGVVTDALTQLREEAARIAEQKRLQSERRARQVRVNSALSVVKEQISQGNFEEAFEQLQRLKDAEGESTDILAVIDLAEAARQEAERHASEEREIAQHVAKAQGLFARNDLTAALARVDAALAIDPRHAGATTLRAKIQEKLEAVAQRRAEEERRAQARASAIADALERASQASSHELAIEALNEVLEMDPSHAEALRLLDTHREAVAQAEEERQRRLAADQTRRERVLQLLDGARKALWRSNAAAARSMVIQVLTLDPGNAAARDLLEEVNALEADQRAAAITEAGSSAATVGQPTDSTVEQRPVGPPAPQPMRPPAPQPVHPPAPQPVHPPAPQPMRPPAPQPVHLPVPQPPPSRPRWMLAAIAAIAAIAIVLAVGYAFFGQREASDVPPGGPDGPVVTTPTIKPPPPLQTHEPSPEELLAQLHNRIRELFAKGEWQEALTLSQESLAKTPEDDELKKIRTDALAAARKGAADARASATRAGARQLASFGSADNKWRTGERLAKAGKTDEAIPLLWQTAASFAAAAAESRGVPAPAPPFKPIGPEVPPVVATSNPPQVIQPTPSVPESPPGAVPGGAGKPEEKTVLLTPRGPTQGDTGPGGVTPQGRGTTPVSPVATNTNLPVPALPVPGGQPAGSPAVPQPPKPSVPPSEEPAIRAVTKAYADAMSSRDVDAVKRVFDKADAAGLRRAFDGLKSQSVTLKAERFQSIGPTTATVSYTQVTTAIAGTGSKLPPASQLVTFRLVKENGTWRIVDRY